MAVPMPMGPQAERNRGITSVIRRHRPPPERGPHRSGPRLRRPPSCVAASCRALACNNPRCSASRACGPAGSTHGANSDPGRCARSAAALLAYRSEAWIPERSATRLREADLNVFSKLGNQGLEWRLEPEAFTRGGRAIASRTFCSLMAPVVAAADLSSTSSRSAPTQGNGVTRRLLRSSQLNRARCGSTCCPRSDSFQRSCDWGGDLAALAPWQIFHARVLGPRAPPATNCAWCTLSPNGGRAVVDKRTHFGRKKARLMD